MNAPLADTPSTYIVELARAIDRRADLSALEFALNVGRLLIVGLYGGNIAAWRAREGREASFRQLAKLTRVSASVLYRSASIYELSQRLDLLRWELPMSHIRAVLGLAEGDQRRLLTQARREQWTVRRMERECAAIRQTLRVRRVGRPPRPPMLTGIGYIERAAKKAVALPEGPLTVEQRSQAIERLDAQIAVLSQMRQRLTTA